MEKDIIVGQIKIDNFTIRSGDYAGKVWIYKDDGEGAALSVGDQLKLKSLLSKFYDEVL